MFFLRFAKASLNAIQNADRRIQRELSSTLANPFAQQQAIHERTKRVLQISRITTGSDPFPHRHNGRPIGFLFGLRFVTRCQPPPGFCSMAMLRHDTLPSAQMR